MAACERKSAVILPEECGYIFGRARLYSLNSVVIFQEECGFIFVKEIVAYLSFSAGRTRFDKVEFPLARLVVLAPHLRTLSGPVCSSSHQHEWKFVMHISGKTTIKHLAQPIQSHMQCFRTL
jgi:hypothetical protein